LSTYAGQFAQLKSTPLEASQYDSEDLRDLLKLKAGMEDVEDRNKVRNALQEMAAAKARSRRGTKTLPHAKAGGPRRRIARVKPAAATTTAVTVAQPVKNPESAAEEAKANAAATKLQAVWRGHMVRQRIKMARERAAVELANQALQSDDYILEEEVDFSWMDTPTDISQLYPLNPVLEEQYRATFIPPPPDTTLPLFVFGTDGFKFVPAATTMSTRSESPIPESPGNVPAPLPPTAIAAPSLPQLMSPLRKDVAPAHENRPSSDRSPAKAPDDDWKFTDPTVAENMRRMYERYEVAQQQRLVQLQQ
jgi:hypothetical protein